MWSKLGVACRWLGVRLLVAIAAWAVMYTSLNYYLTCERDQALGWYKARDIPVFPAVFDKPAVDPKEDAEPLWRAAAELAKGIDLKGEGQLGDFLGYAVLKDGQLVTSRSEGESEGERPLTAEELVRLRKGLAEGKEVLDLLHQAALRPKYSSTLDYRKGMAIHLDDAVASLGMARLLRLAAAVAVVDGHVDRATPYWESLRAIERWNADERLLVCQLIAVSQEGLLCESVQQSLRSGAFGEKRMKALMAEVAADASPLRPEIMRTGHVRQIDAELKAVATILEPVCDYREQLRRGLTGEAFFQQAMFHGILEGGTNDPLDCFGARPRGAAGLLRLVWLADETAGLDQWRRLLESAESDCLPSQFYTLSRDKLPWYARMTKIIMPAISRVPAMLAKAEATRRITAWGVALRRHKLATGEYPDRLADVTPEFRAGLGEPTDPFTGKALVYQRRGAGFTIYSVGPNMTDDGGKNDKDSGGTADDVAFAMEE
jgi:hypothetical protein